jgi:hypothetical protein
MRTYVAVKEGGGAAGNLGNFATSRLPRTSRKPLKVLATWAGNQVASPVASETARARPPHKPTAREDPRGRGAAGVAGWRLAVSAGVGAGGARRPTGAMLRPSGAGWAERAAGPASPRPGVLVAIWTGGAVAARRTTKQRVNVGP